jgi:hypothetical protein
MKRIIPITLLFAVLAACGSDAESREDSDSEASAAEWAPEGQGAEGTLGGAGTGEGAGSSTGPASGSGTTALPPRPGSGATAAGSAQTSAQAGADATAQAGASQSGATQAGSAQAGAEPPPPPETPIRRIPAGAVLTFQVQRDVSTASAQVGESFNLVLVDPVSGEGDAMLTSGTRAVGVVTEVRRSTGPEEESLLAIRVSSVELRGAQTPIEGQVVSTEVVGSTRASGTRSAATVATGSAAGAVIGRILGRDTRSTVTGAAVGTALGVAVALTTRGGDSVLATGSKVVVRLDRDLVY